MAEHDDMPRFPDIIPSSMREGALHEIEEGDIATAEDLQILLDLMYTYPERDFYYFRKMVSPSSGPLDRAISEGIILKEEAEFFWYTHPKNPHDYVRIEVRDGKYQWDWQKEAVEKSPMSVRIKLRLSERKRREMEIKETVEAQREADANPVELKPNVMGFGLDLLKAFRWLRKRIKR